MLEFVSSNLQFIVFIVITCIIIVLIRTWIVLNTIRRHRMTQQDNNNKKQQQESPLNTLVVLGSGGHTTEMLHLMKNLDPMKYHPITFIIATTDTTSEQRVIAFANEIEIQRQENTNDSKPNILTPFANTNTTTNYYYKIPRSREVGQSYITSIGTTLWSFIYAIGFVAKIRPDLVLCNGPGTCLPIAIVTFLFRILGYCKGNIIFIESFCRVTSLSLTGHLLYEIVDLFVVHWDQLHKKYPKSEIVSTFVPRSSTSSSTTSTTATTKES